jgi:hypothetical protein
MNNAFIHADIFFFVTTISVALLTILLVIAWIYGMKIMNNIRYISDQAKLWSDKTNVEVNFLLEEIQTLRNRIRRNRFNIFALFRLIQSIFSRYSYKV